MMPVRSWSGVCVDVRRAPPPIDTRAGRSKRIEDYVGAPEGLSELEQLIDEVARTKQWVSPD